MNKALFLNDMGARLIETGKYKLAAKSLNDGLQILKQSVVDDKNAADANSSQEGSSSIASMDSSDSIHSAEVEPTQSAPTHPDTSRISDGPFFYRKPAFVQHVDNAAHDATALTIGMLYNLALCHTLRGIEKSSRSILRVALRTYELAYYLQLQDGVCLSMSHAMGLVNNCGQIQKMLDRKQTADQLFEHLLTTLVTMVDAGESETLDEIEGFFSATSHLIFVKDTGAAAAA